MPLTKKQEFKLKTDVAKESSYDISRLAVSVSIQYEKGDHLLRVRRNQVIFSEALLEDYPYESIKAVFMHGICYIMLRHEARGSLVALTSEEKYLWAIASEACRSDFLLRMFPGHSVALPFITTSKINELFGGLLGSSWKKIPFGAAVEEIYQQLREGTSNIENQLQLSPILSPPNENGEQESEGEGGSLSEVETDGAAEEAIQNAVKHAVSTMNRGLNSLPGELQYFYRKINADYNDVGRIQKLLKALVFGGPGKLMPSNRRRRRNPCPDVILFQYRRKGFGRVAVIADVSGSTSDHRDRLFEVLVASVKSCDRIDLFVGDTTILEQRIGVHHAEQIQGIPSGGGTDMASIINQVDAKGYRYIVVVSDGSTPWPQRETIAETIYFPFGDFILTGVPQWIKIA